MVYVESICESKYGAKAMMGFSTVGVGGPDESDTEEDPEGVREGVNV